jgi:hypothetical protein
MFDGVFGVTLHNFYTVFGATCRRTCRCLSLRLGVHSECERRRTPSAIVLRAEKTLSPHRPPPAIFEHTATYGCGECGFQLHGLVVLGVARRAGLLAPRLFDPAGIDRIEAEFHQAQHLCTRFDGIASDRKRNAVGRARRPPIFEKALEEDAVERLDAANASLTARAASALSAGVKSSLPKKSTRMFLKSTKIDRVEQLTARSENATRPSTISSEWPAMSHLLMSS